MRSINTACDLASAQCGTDLSNWQNHSCRRSDVAKHDAVPSGHLQSAIVTVVVIMENYPEQTWMPWVAWPMMGLFAYSLPATDIHWWSDLPIGVYLGYRFGKIVTRNNRKKTETVAKKTWDWDVYPTMSRTGDYMMTLGIQF